MAWYEALLGWKGQRDEGSQNETYIGDIGGALIRGGNANAPGGLQAGRGGGAGAAAAAGGATGRAAATGTLVRRTTLGHISFGITPWPSDAEVVKAELEKRGLSASEDTGASGPIATAAYKSYHTNTPDGFNLQISNMPCFAAPARARSGNVGTGRCVNRSHAGGPLFASDGASSRVAENASTHSTFPRPLSSETRYGDDSVSQRSMRKPARSARSNSSSRPKRCRSESPARRAGPEIEPAAARRQQAVNRADEVAHVVRCLVDEPGGHDGVEGPGANGGSGPPPG